ncbi:hypothetical protein M426DRAFT_256704 [Hypoxylon sp. CI-4A]|nr:hypothetical protein M426DRAFT_256704 [Hypoxylon sp. CI-4A]
MTNDMHVEPLSPLDLLMPATYIRMLLTFDTSAPSTSFKERLQRGLDITSRRFPYLCGRVFPTSPTSGAKPSLEVRWSQASDSPTLVDIGPITESYDSLSAGGMQPASLPPHIWPTVDATCGDSGAPVFAASFFRFSDNKGLGLCLCMHHNVTDAAGLTDIIRFWVQAMAESNPPSLSPAVGRCARLEEKLSRQLDSLSSTSLDELFAAHPEYSRAPPAMPSEFPTNACKLYSVPLSRIQAIREELDSYAEGEKLTTNTLLCAMLWASITRARLQRKSERPSEATSRLVMAVDGRQRIDPEFSKPESMYVGNTILYALSGVSTTDLSETNHQDSPRAIAAVCRAITASYAPERIDSRSIAEVYSLVNKMGNYKGIFPGWDLFNSRDLTITSWANLDLHELDFGEGLGNPTFVRPPYTEADGVCIVLPRRRKISANHVDEKVEVQVMLRKDDMALLEQDGFWRTLTQ